MSVGFEEKGKHVFTVSWGSRAEAAFTATGASCGECQASCQSACKTSCTVGNQTCALLEEERGAAAAEAR